MADYRIQLKDKEGNRQFPVTTTQSIVDSEGRSLEEILANLKDNSGSIDPEMIEGFVPLSRDFSDDFNNDFAR